MVAAIPTRRPGELQASHAGLDTFGPNQSGPSDVASLAPMIRTPAEEPEAAAWIARPVADLLAAALDAADAHDGRPAIIAVDGRSASGKTTLASRLAALVENASLVHSDDVAWWESFFAWDHLMAAGILEPLHRGRSVDFRPPAWDRRGREGSIVVPSDTPLVIVEGVGVSRRSLQHLLDGAFWVQADIDESRRRGIARDGGRQQDVDFWDEWDREEVPFIAADQPWSRAHAIVCGTPELTGITFDAKREVLVGLLPAD